MDTPPLIRQLTADDLGRLVAIDRAHTGQDRRSWFALRLRQAPGARGIDLSLAAEVDGHMVGALLAEVQSGEFGQTEPTAVLDTVVVDPAFEGHGVGRALCGQLLQNLQGLRVERVRTQLGWQEQDLLRFLAHQGFEPVPRLVLERRLG